MKLEINQAEARLIKTALASTTPTPTNPEFTHLTTRVDEFLAK